MALSDDENTKEEHSTPFALFDVEEVLLQLNIDEKVSLLSGRAIVKLWKRVAYSSRQGLLAYA
jgi:hypothetical protein